MTERKSAFAKPAIAVLAVIAAAGVAAWVYQQSVGLSATGMNNLNSWGTYIGFFMWFVGLSAGGLIVASSASVFNIPQFKAVAKPAILLSTVCICAAALLVVIDLGGVARIWRLFTGLNFASPLAWDICVIFIYLVVNIVYLRLYTRPNIDQSKVKIVSFIALPVAILVHSVTAWIFGLEIGREWHSSIMAPLFVASALDSGLALLLIVLAALDKTGVQKTDPELMRILGGLLAVFIAVDGFMVGCELLTLGYPGGEGGAYLMQLATGPYAFFFWVEILGGIIVPFFLLAPKKNRARRSVVVAGSILVVLGVLCKRIWLLLNAFVTPNVDAAPGITVGNVNLLSDGTSAYATTGFYVPTAIEFVIMLGVISLVALAYLLLARRVIDKGEKSAS